MREGQAWCGDLASDTGLIVNEGVVRECPIEAQDVVRIGNSEFKVMSVADKTKASGLGKMLPWLLLLAAGGFIAYLLGSQKPALPPPAAEAPVPVVTKNVTQVENETNVSNVVTVVTVTNATGVVVVRTNVVTRVVAGADGKGADLPPPKVCACPPGTKHLQKCRKPQRLPQ